MKNYKKYAAIAVLWTLYLVVGTLAFFVANTYFKFSVRDAALFGIVNLAVVVIITEGIDWLLKKRPARKQRKLDDENDSKGVNADSDATVETEAKISDERLDSDTAEIANVESPPVESDKDLPEAQDGFYDDELESDKSSLQAEASVEEPKEDDAKNVETSDEGSVKSSGRRADPSAVMDAATSSIKIITPDLIVSKSASVAAKPVIVSVEPAMSSVDEVDKEETSLSAEEFLNTTKLSSPRAIVREYQRLGGKDDIYNSWLSRQG